MNFWMVRKEDCLEGRLNVLRKGLPEMQPCVERGMELQSLVKSSVDLPLEFFFPLMF